MLRPVVHLALHCIVPAVVARSLYAGRWKWAWCIMMLTMGVDADHLFADPVYDPQRCGIGFHPLHSYPAIMLYVVMTVLPRVRLVAFGLVIHMVLDSVDCVWLAFESESGGSNATR